MWVNVHVALHVKHGPNLGYWKYRFIHEWHSHMFNYPRPKECRIFRTELTLEPYFIKLWISCGLINSFEQLGRRRNNIPFIERKCYPCQSNGIGYYEFHVIFSGKYFKQLKRNYVDIFHFSKPNIIKFMKLFQCTNINILRKHSKFCERK